MGSPLGGSLYGEYFIYNNVDYIGHCERTSFFKSKEITNLSFREFCLINNIAVKGDYRAIRPNLRAGYKSASKYDKKQPILDDSIWATSGEWTKQHFNITMAGSRVMSEEEAISELDLTTSCGYPWNLTYQGKDLFLQDERARQAITDYWNEAMLADPPQMIPIWTVTQKRELRPIEKVLNYNHRTFTASPIEVTVATNRLCLDANKKMYESYNRTWSYVGSTKFLSNWDELYRRLNKHPNAFCIDGKNYDASLFAMALYGQRDIRFSFLRSSDQTQDNWNRLHKTYENTINSIMVMEDGVILQKHTGNPSGSSNTVNDNTMILYRLFAYSWLVLCKNINRATSRNDFESNVEAALYGDDNTFTCSNDVVSFFNPTTISEIWTSIGVVATTDCYTPRKVCEVDFLSNGFHYNPVAKIWLPYPNTEKVLCSLKYGSAIDDVRWHFLRACALRIDSYGNPTLRAILRDYINFLDSNYADKLHGSVQRGDEMISMKDIRMVWKSDDWILALYSGKETLPSLYGVVDVSAQQHLIKLNNINYNEIKQSLNTMGTKKKAQFKKIVKKDVKKIIKQKKPRRSRGPKSSLGKTILTGGGRMLGSLVGMGDTGAAAGSFFSKILGMGAYKVNSNSIMKDSTQAPIFDSGDKSVTICHSELVTDIIGSVAFSSRNFMIDPVNYATFPYLASLAQNFEQYEFLGLVFTYKPTSGSAIASTNNSLGTVIMSTEYDVSREVFINKVDMEAYEFATSCEPCNIMHHPVECNPTKDVVNRRYLPGPFRKQKLTTYTNAPALSVQGNLNEIGRLQVATVGMQAAVNVGELWVSYKIKFSIPRKVGVNNILGWYHAASNVALPVGAATALATSYNVMNESTNSLAAVDFTVSGTDSRINLTGLSPGTKVLVNLIYYSATGTITSPAMTGTNVTAAAFYAVDSTGLGNSSYFTPNAQITQNLQTSWIVSDTSFVTATYVTIPVPTIATATMAWDLFVTIIPRSPNFGTLANPYITSIVERNDEYVLQLKQLNNEMKLLKNSASQVLTEEKENEVSLAQQIADLKLENKQLASVLQLCNDSEETEQGEVLKVAAASATLAEPKFKQSLLQSLMRK